MKTCNKCKENKELTEFSRHDGASDGLHPSCRLCVREYQRIRRDAKRPMITEKYAEYYQKNKEKQSAYYEEQYQDPEKRKARCERSRQWRKDNPEKLLAQIAYRRAKKLKATPAWADKAAILAIYKECVRITTETGIAHQVDHIIPLNGTLVSGLHVESNLQIITAEENNKKNNSFNLDA